MLRRSVDLRLLLRLILAPVTPSQHLRSPLRRLRPRRHRANMALLIHKLKVIPAQQVRNRRQLRPVPVVVLVKLEQRHRQQLHVLGHGEDFGVGQVDQVELLALLGPGDVRGQERVHEGLEVGPPPLRQAVAHLPLVVDGVARELVADGREALIEARLEARDLVVGGAEVVAWSVCALSVTGRGAS